MQTIFLHIGRGKTGTTALQHYLFQIRAELLEQGVRYLSAGDHNGGGHQQFAKSFVVNRPDPMIPAIDPERSLAEAATEISETQCDVLVSSENFAIAEPHLVAKFFTALSKPVSVKIIYLLRSQDEVAESEYNQLVRLKRETCSFDEYAHQKLAGCDYAAVADEWAKYFGQENMLCRIYDGRRDAIPQVLDCLNDLDLERLPDCPNNRRASAANISIGYKALTALRLMNGVKVEDRNGIGRQIIDAIGEDDVPALFFDCGEARRFRERFAQSNRSVTRKYCGKEMADIGGRRYSDNQRSAIRDAIKKLGYA